ncbi:DUF1462 family protein [Sporolactobacillus sp. THM7-7]|nr:DUF1462 family protein [Sporolactobacillus sp. THM7-7]
MKLTVYGAESVCSSCVQAPPARATAEWLSAAIGRKYGDGVTVRYVDIYEPKTEEDRLYCTKVAANEFFYPLVVAGGRVLGEGVVTLKPIFQFLEQHGFQAVRSDERSG